MDKLESDSEDGLDVTTYEYRNDLMTSSKTTAEYYEIGSDGYITEKKGVKENKINYNGDNPVSEKEDEPTRNIPISAVEYVSPRCRVVIEGHSLLVF